MLKLISINNLISLWECGDLYFLINERDSSTVPATVNRAAFKTTGLRFIFFNIKKGWEG